MFIAIVGCGFVADYYMKTLRLHAELKVIGVTDRDFQRAQRFASYYGTHHYPTLENALDDSRVEMILNLTNPGSHYDVSLACLRKGKHVYSEKPLAMQFHESMELVELARQMGVHLSAAPCSILNESAQTFWKAVREEQIGTPRLVYAQFDDGLIHKMPYQKWRSESGTPWPYKDEFEVGATVEHAGYPVSWLVAFFGPVRKVHAFAKTLIPEKVPGVPLAGNAPDFSVACLEFQSGMLARLTCGVIAPRDHSITVFGDKGVMWVKDSSNDRSPIYIRRYFNFRRRLLTLWRESYPMVGKRNPQAHYRGAQKRNFASGIAEFNAAIQERRLPRLSPDYCLHINEIVLAIHNAREFGGSVTLSTSCENMKPMPYALLAR